MKNSKSVFFGSIIGLVVLFFIGSLVYNKFQSKEFSNAIAEDSGLLIREHSPSIGSPLLRVTLVEFLDPECESCSFFHPIVKSILKQHEGRIRYVVRYAPFHPNSKFVIEVLEAARAQGKYWEALDLFFEKLPEWGDHGNPRPDLILTYLPALGLDVTQVQAAIENSKTSTAKMIEQEVSDGIKLGVRQTPTFFLNGERVNFRDPQDLIDAVALVLK